MNILVDGADRVARNLRNYAQQLMPKIDNDIWFVGEQAKQRLQLKFPDLSIQGNFYPDQHAYVLTISISGMEMSWIFCPYWHLYYKIEGDHIRGERPKTWSASPQEFKSSLPELADEVNKELSNISSELIPRINQSIIYKSY